MKAVHQFAYYVKARAKEHPFGQVSEGHDDEAVAFERARNLAEQATSDVLVIKNDVRDYVVTLFKGVQWFCEAQLNAHFAGWRHHTEEPRPVVMKMPFIAPAREMTVIREVVLVNGVEETVETVIEREWRDEDIPDEPDTHGERVA